MIKDAMEKNEKATPNGADLEVLKKHFGMCFNSDGSLDLEKLKARLGIGCLILVGYARRSQWEVSDVRGVPGLRRNTKRYS